MERFHLFDIAKHLLSKLGFRTLCATLMTLMFTAIIMIVVGSDLLFPIDLVFAKEFFSFLIMYFVIPCWILAYVVSGSVKRRLEDQSKELDLRVLKASILMGVLLPLAMQLYVIAEMSVRTLWHGEEVHFYSDEILQVASFTIVGTAVFIIPVSAVAYLAINRSLKLYRWLH